MTDDPHDLPTRWSRLESMQGPEGAASWAWFVGRYRPYVGAVLTRLGLRRNEVDEALDDFWGYLYRSGARGRADRDGRFRSFLAGVARNFGLSWLRQQRSSSAPLEGDVLAPADRDQDLALWGEHLLQLALARLDSDHNDEARAVRWFYGLGTQLGEAGEQLRGTEIAARTPGSRSRGHRGQFPRPARRTRPPARGPRLAAPGPAPGGWGIGAALTRNPHESTGTRKEHPLRGTLAHPLPVRPPSPRCPTP
jgi:DNA-directed RNA polymerase specialized sigma24 family protein